MPSFDEFLAEFPREYRHADPLYRVLARVVARLLVDPARARGSGQPLALLEMGSGLGEHALYYSHLNAAGALDWAAAAPGAPGGGDEVGAPVPAKFTAPSDRQPAAAPPAVVWQPTEIGAAMAELRGVWAKLAKGLAGVGHDLIAQAQSGLFLRLTVHG